MQFDSRSRRPFKAVCVFTILFLSACGDATDSPENEENTGDPVSTVCGDGLVGADEFCDGAGLATADCDTDCTQALCGDGLLNGAAGETCDDGNTLLEACDYGTSSCTVCGPSCTQEPGEVLYCGNGSTDGPEFCDEGGDAPNCDADCTEVTCGDSYQNTAADEECDDGNTVTEICDYGLESCDVCNFLCDLEPGGVHYCGDGDIDYSYGEACDDSGETETCDPDCTFVECGDGVHNVAAGEICDAGTEVTDTCDYGLTECEVCSESCALSAGLVTYCGDGVVDANFEFCELGETTTMACTAFAVDNFESGTVHCGTDCMADTSGCVEIPRNAQYEACTDAGLSPFVQGSCEDELYCLPLTTDTTGYCMLPCEGELDTQTCGDDRCHENPAGWFCYQDDALRDEPCRDNLRLCAEGEGECIDRTWDQAAGIHIDPRCTIACDGIYIGQAGTCPEGESCFTNSGGYADVAGDASGQPMVCEDDPECPYGFDCLLFSNGDKYCAKMHGWCGEPTPICGTIDNYDWYNCLFDPAMQCSLADGHKHCAVSDAEQTPATTQCVDVGMGYGLCLAFCDGPDETELDCGAGYECVIPGEAQWAYMWTLEDPQVPCDPASDGIASTSVCGLDYQCMSFTIGAFCGRPVKHCQEIRPIVEAVEPAIGSVAGGTAISVRGQYFRDGSQVLVGGIYAQDVVWVSDSEITAVAPSRTPGVVDVTIRSPAWQEGVLSLGFEFAVDPPVINSISPDHGPESGGTMVIIEGANFPEFPVVTFGEVVATDVTAYNYFYPSGWKTIWAYAPPGSGVVDIKVENTGVVYLAEETSVPWALQAFTYDAPEVEPADACDATDAEDPTDSDDPSDAADSSDESDPSDATEPTDAQAP